MKKYLLGLPAVLIIGCLVWLLCCHMSSASELEHEFLTPQVVVLKCSKPITVKKSSVKIINQGVWQKENALLRKKNGEITRQVEITHYLYLQLERPLQDQEILVLESSCGKLELQYSSATPSHIYCRSSSPVISV